MVGFAEFAKKLTEFVEWVSADYLPNNEDCLTPEDMRDEALRSTVLRIRSDALALLDAAEELGLSRTGEKLRDIVARASALAACGPGKICLAANLCGWDLANLYYSLIDDMAEMLDELAKG